MLLKRLNELPQTLADLIRLAGHIADEQGINAFVVGGFVRDLFLGVDNFDVDFVVEGDGIAFATEISKRLRVRMVAHKRFGTATLFDLDGFKADIATTRKEIYAKAAALPTVSQGKIEDDLLRRDFTINAMAICINRVRFGQIIDFYGGQKDLKEGIVRALHPLSFIDDPTRILRAIRFEQRFDFKIEKSTLDWIKNALRLGMLHKVGKHRLRDELILIFKELKSFKALKKLNDLCGFSYIAPGLRFVRDWRISFDETARKICWFKEHFSHKRHLEPYVIYMSLFFYSISLKSLKKVIFDFAFHKAESSRMISAKENLKMIQKELIRKDLRPSMVFRLLEPLSYEVIVLILVFCRHSRAQKRIEDFLFIYNSQRLHIRGEDLATIGLKPGPHYKKILEELLYAKIDGKIRDKEEELMMAERLAHK